MTRGLSRRMIAHLAVILLVQTLGAIAQFMRLNDREALEETWRMNAKVLKDIPSPPLAGIRVVRDFLGQTDPR